MLVNAEVYREFTASCWAVLPERFRQDGHRSEWLDANRRGSAVGSFLEGPDLAPDGTVYCVDIPFGRIFSVSGQGAWNVVCEYDGWPNGLKVQQNGRLLIADHKNGIVEVDPRIGKAVTLLGHRNSQAFLGLNDLQIAADNAIWFTDQGQTGLHDPAGKVYRWVSGQAPVCILDGLPSPNGVRVSLDGRELFVAVTRDNSVWRAPLMAAGEASKVGRFAMFYGPTGPDGLHIDSRGYLWVCLPGADTIWILDAQAEITGRIRFPAGAFPTNLVVDEHAGRAYVTCSGLQSIFIVSFNFN
ncbi:SMP-30/gluconolactonase/LRE family protein [Polaromonas sp. P1(28)-13]|nr:SMP-30/gluconolactonase/LRE family protein [Polaromonas sp. P1(28)-13]